MTVNLGAFAHTSVVKSPLGGVRYGSPTSVSLSEIPFTQSFDLRVRPQTPAFSAVTETLGIRLPTKVGQIQPRLGDIEPHVHALCLGPDAWLILGEIDAIQMLEPLRAEFHFSIVDVSAQRTQIEVEGPMARQVLEHVWEQDLRGNHFGVGSCSQGLMAKAPTVLWHQCEHRSQIFRCVHPLRRRLGSVRGCFHGDSMNRFSRVVRFWMPVPQ